MADLTRPASSPDLRPLFTALYLAWVEQGHGKSLAALAGVLVREDGAQGVTRHTLARYQHTRIGDAARQPPLWLLLNLCRRTGMVIELGPDQARLVVATPPSQEDSCPSMTKPPSR